MRFEWAVSLRYFRSPRAEGAISLITWIAVLGVTLGVAALVVAMAVMNGYQANLVRAMAASLPHVSVYPAQEGGFRAEARLEALLREQVRPQSIAPFSMQQAMVKPAEGRAGMVRGVMLRGIDPDVERDIPEFLALLDDGAPGWEGLAPAERAGRARALLARLEQPAGDAVPVLVSRVLAEKLGVGLGRRLVPLEFPKAHEGFSPVPRPVPLEVVGHFETGIMAFDELVLLLHMRDLPRVTGSPPQERGLGLRLAEPLEAGATAALLRQLTPPGDDAFQVYSWLESNKGLFQVIRVQKVMLFLVLMLIVVIAFFGMISALIMLVSEKTREIAILKSLGARARSIRGIFVAQGLVIGAAGTALGVGLGLAVCWVLGTFPVIDIPHGVYPGSDRVPVLVAWSDVLWVIGGTMAVCLGAAIYPAQKAMALPPAEGLRYE